MMLFVLALAYGFSSGDHPRCPPIIVLHKDGTRIAYFLQPDSAAPSCHWQSREPAPDYSYSSKNPAPDDPPIQPFGDVGEKQ